MATQGMFWVTNLSLSTLCHFVIVSASEWTINLLYVDVYSVHALPMCKIIFNWGRVFGGNCISFRDCEVVIDCYQPCASRLTKYMFIKVNEWSSLCGNDLQCGGFEDLLFHKIMLRLCIALPKPDPWMWTYNVVTLNILSKSSSILKNTVQGITIFFNVIFLSYYL